MKTLVRFRMVAARPGALWRGREVPQGTAALIIAGESEDDVRWFFSKIDWTSWKLDPVAEDADIPSDTARTPNRKIA